MVFFKHPFSIPICFICIVGQIFVFYGFFIQYYDSFYKISIYQTYVYHLLKLFFRLSINHELILYNTHLFICCHYVQLFVVMYYSIIVLPQYHSIFYFLIKAVLTFIQETLHFLKNTSNCFFGKLLFLETFLSLLSFSKTFIQQDLILARPYLLRKTLFSKKVME